MTSPIRFSCSTVRILSPILKGLADRRSTPAMALLIVFLEENPITVPAAILIALAAIPLTDENWNIMAVIAISIRTSFTIELIPFNWLSGRFSDLAILFRK